jgi:hypothetical protein
MWAVFVDRDGMSVTASPQEAKSNLKRIQKLMKE